MFDWFTARFFDGLELLPPGVVSTPLWRPDPDAGTPAELGVACGVARKPVNTAGT
jgi:hypothetical protein